MRDKNITPTFESRELCDVCVRVLICRVTSNKCVRFCSNHFDVCPEHLSLLVIFWHLHIDFGVGSPRAQWNNNYVPTNGKQFQRNCHCIQLYYYWFHPTDGTLSNAIEFSYIVPVRLFVFHWITLWHNRERELVYRYGWCNETNGKAWQKDH